MKRNIIFGLIIGLLIMAISSCGLAGTSMSDRIDYFEEDLNGSRANIFDNLHPDSDGYRQLDDTYWSITDSTWDPAFKTFYIINISEGSSSVNATFKSLDYPAGVDIYIDMKDDGDFFSGEDWKIWSCTVDGNPQF